MDRADSLQRLRAVEPVLKDLPSDTRRTLRETVGSPEFARKATKAQQAFHSSVPEAWQPASECCDLVAEAMRVAIELEQSAPSGKSGGEQILSRLESMLDSAEECMTGFGASLGPPPPDTEGPTTLREQIRATGAITKNSGGDPQTSLELRRRLGFLFQTGGTKANLPQEEKKTGTPKKRRDRAQPEGAVTFPEGIQSFEPPPLQTGSQHVRIVLEMLASETHRQPILDNWDAVLARLLEIGRDSIYLETTIQEIAHSLEDCPAPKVEDLLDQILFRVRKPADLLKALQTIVLPISGGGQVRRFLQHSCRRSPRKAVVLLSYLDREGQGTICELAADELTVMARDAILLAVWSGEDPSCLARPEVKILLTTIPAEDLRAAFREFFARITQEQAAAFLVRLPSGVAGLENVLFTAMDHGSPLTRKLAMTHLGRYPTPQVTQTLIEVIKLNNYREKPFMPEVEAALTALLDITNDAAQSFLQNVRRKRRWFFRVYKKPIRRLLAEIVANRRASQDESAS